MNKEYKTFEELKEELGDKFEEFMYKANIELLDKVNQLEDKLNKINAIVSNIDEKKIPKYQDKVRDIKFCLEYDFWANQKVKCDREMSPEELEIHNILLEKIKKEGSFNE